MKNKLSFITLVGILLFSVSSIAQPYCNSSYPSYFFDYIANVNFNTITNPSGSSGYSDFTSLNTNIDIGDSYNLTATILNIQSSTIYVTAWIDWNQDFDFDDPGESYSLGTVVGLVISDVSVNIMVPATASLGSTRMRISAARGFVPDPCNSAGYLYGETEDYSVTIFSPPVYFYWDGESDTKWSNPLNWDNDIVPTSSDPVIIPAGAPNYPYLTDALSIGAPYNPNECQSLKIENGGSVTLVWYGLITIFSNVTIETGGALNVNRLYVEFGGSLYINGGDVSVNDECLFKNYSTGDMNSGSLSVGGILEFNQYSDWTASGGVVYCKGSTDTEIISSSSPNVVLNNLTIENAGTARLSGNSEYSLFVINNLTVEPNAEFTLEEPVSGSNVSSIIIGQNLTLEGTVSGKSSFIDENGATILAYGTTAAESYYEEDRWHFISSPVSSAVSGVFLDLYLKAFDESNNEYTPSPGITSTTYPLGIGQGFETFSDVGNGSPTISYVGGQLNTGDLSPTFTATDINGNLSIGDGEGWNLIGNPYPSAIDVGTENDPVSGYTWTNIDSTIYAWNGTGWASFNMAGNGTGINGGTRYLPSMQGFFLKANDFNPSFGFANSARLHSTQSNYKSSIDENFEIRLVVIGNGYSDEMLVRTISSASDLFDSKYDAYKLPGLVEVPQIYSKAASSLLSINTLSEFTEESIVPVCIEVGVSGIYSIETNDFDLSEKGLTVYLEDLKEESIASLNANSSYEFSSEPNDQEHRFNLIFKNAFNESDNLSHTQIFSSDDIIYINKEAGINSNIFVYDLMGREVNRVVNNMDDRFEIQVSNGTGNYIVRLVTDSYTETKKVFIK